MSGKNLRLSDAGLKKIKEQLKAINKEIKGCNKKKNEWKSQNGSDFKSFFKGGEKINIAEIERYIKTFKNIDCDIKLRDKITKLLNRKEGLTKKSLDDFFGYLDLTLEYGDYEEYKITKLSPREAENFKQILGQLNYRTQKSKFEEEIEQKYAKTVLIYGDSGYGQFWLLNQLIYNYVPCHNDAFKIRIKIVKHRTDISHIWHTLANSLGTTDSPQAIAEQLYQHWKSPRTIIIVIDNFSDITDNSLKTLMQELWINLLIKVNNTSENEIPKHGQKLLLFLVGFKDSQSKLREASVCLLQNTNRDSNQFDTPLYLPELKAFEENMIVHWINTKDHQVSLSKFWKKLQRDSEMSQELLKVLIKSEQPMFVLTEICKCFELDWYQDIQRTLTL